MPSGIEPLPGTRPASAVLLLVAIALVTAADVTAQPSEDSDWRAIRPLRETGCGFGTPFEFWIREGDPERVLVYLQGGGGCWDHASCTPGPTIQFDTAVDSTDHEQRRTGIFDRASEANPFRDHTAVFVPYCTGDFHLGNRTVRYDPPAAGDAEPVTVLQIGSRNLAAVLAHLAARSVVPRRVTVVGGSAGAIASPFFAAMVAELFPKATIRQIGDGTGGLRLPQTRALLARWGADSVLAAAGLALPDSGDALAGIYRASAARHPRIGFSQVSTSEDARVAGVLRLFGEDPPDVAGRIAATYRELEEAGLCFHGYVLPGTVHTILWREEFLMTRIDGKLLGEILERELLESSCEAGTDLGRTLDELATAAARLLASLDPDQRAAASFAVDAAERTRWAYIPGARPGLTLKAMKPHQRALAHELLRTLLGHEGYLKVNAIMGLETYLQTVERDGWPRDPEAYVLAIFGTPAPTNPWGIRFEGHHVSVNVTVAGADHVAATPLFLGANPATVPTGPQAGLRILAPEEAAARALLDRLTADQRRAAIVGDEVPPDLFTTNVPLAPALERVGLPMASMTEDQQAALLRLLRVYVDNLNPEIAAREWERIRALDPGILTFVWLGSTTPGEPHYYRIQGEELLVEYDHTSNHVHTVWRDRSRDFGRDLLREHHATAAHHHASAPESSSDRAIDTDDAPGDPLSRSDCSCF